MSGTVYSTITITMSFDRQTFESRKALLHLGGLLSDNDSKKIVFLLGLPKKKRHGRF